jgi:DNA-binding response OmpR family regulator
VDQDVGEDPNGILRKPFDFPELGQRVRFVLDEDSKVLHADLTPPQTESSFENQGRIPRD